MCEGGGGRPGLPVPESVRSRWTSSNTELQLETELRAVELCESRGERLGSRVPNRP